MKHQAEAVPRHADAPTPKSPTVFRSAGETLKTDPLGSFPTQGTHPDIYAPSVHIHSDTSILRCRGITCAGSSTQEGCHGGVMSGKLGIFW